MISYPFLGTMPKLKDAMESDTTRMLAGAEFLDVMCDKLILDSTQRIMRRTSRLAGNIYLEIAWDLEQKRQEMIPDLQFSTSKNGVVIEPTLKNFNAEEYLKQGHVIQSLYLKAAVCLKRGRDYQGARQAHSQSELVNLSQPTQ